MDIFGYLKVIIIAMFCALIVMVVLNPIMQQTNETPVYEANEEYARPIAYHTGTEEYSYEFTITEVGENSITVTVTENGGTPETKTVDFSLNKEIIMVSDTCIIRARGNSVYITYEGGDPVHGRYGNVGDTFSYDQGVITVTRTTGSGAFSAPAAYLYNTTSETDTLYYILATSQIINVSKNSTILALYHSSSIEGYASGTVDNLQTAVINQQSNTYEWSATYESEDYYYELSAVTVSFGETTDAATIVIAPLEYVSGYVTNTDLTHTMLALLPLILLVAIIMAVISAVIRDR